MMPFKVTAKEFYKSLENVILPEFLFIAIVKARDGGKCQKKIETSDGRTRICGSKVNVLVHHLNHKGHAHDHWIGNGSLRCDSHHNSEHPRNHGMYLNQEKYLPGLHDCGVCGRKTRRQKAMSGARAESGIPETWCENQQFHHKPLRKYESQEGKDAYFEREILTDCLR